MANRFRNERIEIKLTKEEKEIYVVDLEHLETYNGYFQMQQIT